MITVGFDNSNYTTSVAYFNGVDGENCSKLLPVTLGALGLRQSDAVFHHTQSLPELSGRLFSNVEVGAITAVGVSTRPRAVEGSYMPCFLVGNMVSETLSSVMNVPKYEFSHQQGHIAAALFSAGRLDLLNEQFIAFHVSGGTTDVILCEPNDKDIFNAFQ